MKLRKRAAAAGALSVGLALAMVGCTGATSAPSGSASGAADNTPVTILGTFTGLQATSLQADLDAWGKTQGITVKYEGNPNFSTTIVTQVKGGQAPDIALFPQPGVLKSLISDGVVALDDLIDLPAATADEAQGIPQVAQVNGKTYGLPYNISVKSLVWYNPAAFKAHGYAVPTTDAEMTALQAKIIADGAGSPWCVGLASQGSNGWPMTDWFEEYVLRYGGLDEYNKWITNDLKFDSPLVNKAADKVESLLMSPGAVNGGNKAMAATDWGTAGNNLFVSGKAKGQCYMMRQGSFVTGSFPKDIQAQISAGDTTNISAFPLPSPADAVTTGVIGGGDIAGAFHNTPNVSKVMAYLVGKDFGKNGYNKAFTAALSPHSSFPADQYYGPFAKVAQQAIANAKAFGFDASDLMPGEIGGGGAAEETHMMQWVAGQETRAQMLQAIDAAWPGK